VTPPEPEPERKPEPEPTIIYVEKPTRKPKREPNPEPKRARPAAYVERVEPEPSPPPTIGWAWFEREPADMHEDAHERAARVLNEAQLAAQWAGDEPWPETHDRQPPETVANQAGNQHEPWWDGSRTSTT
jgi:hypothetical protein